MGKDIGRRVIWLVLAALLLKGAVSVWFSQPLWHAIGRSTALLAAFAAFLSLWSFAEAVWTRRST